MPCWINNPPSNGGTDSFKVVDTNPSDGDNIVPVDLAEIIVKFNKNIERARKVLMLEVFQCLPITAVLSSAMIPIFRMYRLVAKLQHFP